MTVWASQHIRAAWADNANQAFHGPRGFDIEGDRSSGESLECGPGLGAVGLRKGPGPLAGAGAQTNPGSPIYTTHRHRLAFPMASATAPAAWRYLPQSAGLHLC